MSLELDDETLEALGWGAAERTRVVERVFAERLLNEGVRVREWRAKNPGWWLKDTWRKSEAGKAANRRAGAKYRAKVRARNAQQGAQQPRYETNAVRPTNVAPNEADGQGEAL